MIGKSPRWPAGGFGLPLFSEHRAALCQPRARPGNSLNAKRLAGLPASAQPIFSTVHTASRLDDQ